MDEIFISNRAVWREWLTLNHGRSPGVWLVFHRSSTRKPSLAYEDAVEEALCFGWIDSIIRKLDAERYARKFTPQETGKQLVREQQEEGIQTPGAGSDDRTGHGRGPGCTGVGRLAQG